MWRSGTRSTRRCARCGRARSRQAPEHARRLRRVAHPQRDAAARRALAAPRRAAARRRLRGRGGRLRLGRRDGRVPGGASGPADPDRARPLRSRRDAQPGGRGGARRARGLPRAGRAARVVALARGAHRAAGARPRGRGVLAPDPRPRRERARPPATRGLGDVERRAALRPAHTRGLRESKARRAAPRLRLRQRELVPAARGVAAPSLPRDADRRGPRLGKARAPRRLGARLRARFDGGPLARPLAPLRVRADAAAARTASAPVWARDDRQPARARPRRRRLVAAPRALSRRRRGERGPPARRVAARARSRVRLAGGPVPRRPARPARRPAGGDGGRLMRILLVAHGFPPGATGGAEIYARAVARELARADEVVVVAREAQPERPEFSLREVGGEPFRLLLVNHTYRECRSFRDTYRDPRLGTLLARLFDEIRPDVAHVHHLTNLTTDGVELLASRGVPIVFTIHDYWLLCQRGQLLDLAYQRCGGPSPAGCARCLGLAGQGGEPLHAARRTLGRAAALLPPALAGSLTSAARGAARALVRGSGRAEAEIVDRQAHVRALAERVSLFLAPSRTLRERFVAAGFPAERIALHPYGHDHAPFGHGLRSSGPLRIGFVGSVMVSKAPHLVLEAFAGLPAGAATLTLHGHYSAYHGDDRYRGVLAPLLEQPGV